MADRARSRLRRAIPLRPVHQAIAWHYDRRMVVIAHVAGIPLEETLAMAVPILGAASAAIVATLRSHRRKLFKRN